MNPRPVQRKRRAAAWLAFTWHTAELGLVGSLELNQPSAVITVLFVLAVVGWLWSACWLPANAR